jgi:hypothetical protein
VERRLEDEGVVAISPFDPLDAAGSFQVSGSDRRR